MSPETSKLSQIRIEELSKSYGGVAALTDVTLNFSSGVIHGIVGPNGAGKTTLLNMLSGIDQPTNGRILFDETDMTDEKTHNFSRRGVARTYQNVKLFTGLTVLENILVGFANQYKHGIFKSTLFVREEIKQRLKYIQEAETLLSEFGLLEQRDEVADNLSYGQQRRVEVARALATRPSCLVLDEPTAGMNSMLDLYGLSVNRCHV
jgi:branched-chain amino acid transport system ATP-binding protein